MLLCFLEEGYEITTSPTFDLDCARRLDVMIDEARPITGTLFSRLSETYLSAPPSLSLQENHHP
jgi:hypothetical protein